MFSAEVAALPGPSKTCMMSAIGRSTSRTSLSCGINKPARAAVTLRSATRVVLTWRPCAFVDRVVIACTPQVRQQRFFFSFSELHELIPTMVVVSIRHMDGMVCYCTCLGPPTHDIACTFTIPNNGAHGNMTPRGIWSTLDRFCTATPGRILATVSLLSGAPLLGSSTQQSLCRCTPCLKNSNRSAVRSRAPTPLHHGAFFVYFQVYNSTVSRYFRCVLAGITYTNG